VADSTPFLRPATYQAGCRHGPPGIDGGRLPDTDPAGFEPAQPTVVGRLRPIPRYRLGVLLNLSVTLLPTNGIVGIDASGFDRSHASKHYTKRTKLTIQQLQVTLLVDTRSNAIIDVHVTTTRRHDSKIVPSLIKRNTGNLVVLLSDKGYDDEKVRALARETGVRPLIKHREFSSLHKAWNARLDADLSGQRSQNETVNSRLKRKYGAFVRSRHWWKQFRELTIACLAHNLDRSL